MAGEFPAIWVFYLHKKYLFQTNSYWSNIKNDPYLYVISDLEALDVDNEEDFIISEAVYKQLSNYF